MMVPTTRTERPIPSAEPYQCRCSSWTASQDDRLIGADSTESVVSRFG